MYEQRDRRQKLLNHAENQKNKKQIAIEYDELF